MRTAAGATMKKLTLNLSAILHSCVLVATTVVSLMNDRLSPKNDPPTTIATTKGSELLVDMAIPAAIGVSATIVPTLVPMLIEMKQAAKKSPGSSMLSGRTERVRLTVASMLPISFAELAKAPASTNIHNIIIMLSVLAPLEYISIRLASGKPPDMAIAKILDTMKATVIGTL